MAVYSVIYSRYNFTELKGIFSTPEKAKEYIDDNVYYISRYLNIVESNLDEEINEG